MAQQNRYGAGMSNLVTNSGLVYIHNNDVFNFAMGLIWWKTKFVNSLRQQPPPSCGNMLVLSESRHENYMD